MKNRNPTNLGSGINQRYSLLSSLRDDFLVLSQKQKIGLVLILLIAVFINADQQALAPNLVAIQKEFRVSDYNVGLMTGAFFVLGAIIGLFIGRRTDLVQDRKRLLVIVTLLDEIPCLLTAFVKTYEQLFAARVLTSFGVIGAFPLLYALMGDYFRKENRNLGNAVIGMVYTLGIVFGQLVSGWIGPTYGWRTPFLVLSVPNFVFLLLFLVFAEIPQKGAAEEPIREKMRRGYLFIQKPRASDYLATLRRPSVFLAVSQGIPGSIAGGMLSLFMVKHFQLSFGWAVERAASVVALMAVAGLFGSILGGYLGGLLYRRDPRFVPALCATTTALGAASLELLLDLQSGASNGLIVSLGVVGSALIFMTIPNLKAVLTNLATPERRGAVFSVLALTDDLGAALGPFVGGIMSTTWGLTNALRLGAGLWFPCALLWLLIAVTYRKGELAADSEILTAAAAMEKAAYQYSEANHDN